MSGQELRIVPYNGNRAYKYYLDGYKVNGKRKRLFFKDVAAANRKLAELAKRQKKEGQDGLDIPLELRVMAVKATQRLSIKTYWTPPSFTPPISNAKVARSLCPTLSKTIWAAKCGRVFRNATCAISVDGLAGSTKRSVYG